MKLKQYILLKDNTIIDTKDGFVSIKGDLKYSHSENGVKTFYDSDIVKTSDNILDLVVIGDLVLHVSGEILKVSRIETKETWQLSSFKNNFSREIYFANVWIIYKKLSNGDYKKYEVER